MKIHILIITLIAFSYSTLFSAGTPWADHLNNFSLIEWPMSDRFSQRHDLRYHSTGKIYLPATHH
jgi:hypothetical protein